MTAKLKLICVLSVILFDELSKYLIFLQILIGEEGQNHKEKSWRAWHEYQGEHSRILKFKKGQNQ